MKITILGVGAWGSALGLVLHRNGHELTYWGHDPNELAEVQTHRCNERFLPGIRLPESWHYESDLSAAMREAELAVIAIPSKAMRTVASRLADYPGILVSATKGIEFDTGLTMCGVLHATCPGARIAAMLGPTIAVEVAREMPAAIVVASEDESVAQKIQSAFHQPLFRVYTSTDLSGVELGSSLKNIIAIAAGVCDGLGFGDNSKAALITRAIVEIRRLGVACGARSETFAGLSALGDLIVTCFSPHSRNRTFGERLGRGEPAQDILRQTNSVVEGYPTTRAAFQLARRLEISTPIIDEVYAMLYENKDLEQAIHDLTSRSSKPEDEDFTGS